MSNAIDVDAAASETLQPREPDPLTIAASERTALLRVALGNLPNKTGKIATPPASMAKDRSPIWKYFCMMEYAEPLEEDKHVMCSVVMTTSAGKSKVCGIPFALSKASSPYNYERHLKRAHPTEAVAYKAASVRTAISKSERTDAAGGGGSSSGGGSAGTALSRAFSRASAGNVQQIKDFQKRLVLWSAIEMKPCNIAASTGFQLVIAMAAPAYAAHSKMHHTTFDNLLIEVHQATKELVITKLREQRDFLFGEPFCALQTDLTTTYNRAFITLSVSFVDSNFDFCRFSLVTREFPLDHKSVQVQAWIVGVTDEWFGDIMPVGFAPKQVYTAGTIDQGGNVFNAVRDAGIIALKCCAHRLNSAVSWALGISGKPPQKTCKNKPFLKVLTSVAKMVGVFSHASANNDALLRIQEQQLADMCSTVEELEEDAEALDADAEQQGGGVPSDGEGDMEAGEGRQAAAVAASARRSAVLNTVRRSDTRWTGNHSMLDRTLQLESAMAAFFKHPDNRKLTDRHISAEQWSSVREACGILDSVAEVMRRIQGSDGKHLSTAHHLMLELRDIVQDEEHEVRPAAYGDDPLLCPREDLTKCVRTLVKVLADEMSNRDLGAAGNVTEQLAIVLDPRFKCNDSRFFPTAAKRARVERQLRAAYRRMRLASVGATTASGDGDSDDESPADADHPAAAGAAAAAAPANEAGEPAIKKPRLSLVQRRAAAALEQQLAEVAAANAAAAVPPPQRSEVDIYLEQAVELKADEFDVLAFWRKKAQPVTVDGVVVAPAEFPLLARVACQYLGIDSTSCQPERNFSALSLTLERLRTVLASWKIEMMMFLRLNRHIIPEFAKVLEVETKRLAQAQANTAEVEALLSDIVGISV